ncbi:helix-turn-helix domain-containing protein [Streptomyces malaysiensis]|uniref:helix-turn-helix domain-containing protein n=1 Tax=Streptomyces malaysiensis TaxID=92644 RepID=UPI00341214DA
MGNARAVEDFAESLRALKERSGRSYGSLATRMHVSTSTLHRYCNGDAVPADYAPVERFARLCGATPEELVTLHRRWIVAEASRRRARESTPGATPSASRGGEADTREGAADRHQERATTSGRPSPVADPPPTAATATTSGPSPVTGPPPTAATATGPAGDSAGPEQADGRSHDARPSAAADERHDAAASADAPTATSPPGAHPAATPASSPGDTGPRAEGDTADDTGPDQSARGHDTARRRGAAQRDGNPHPGADATERPDDGRAPSASAPGQAQPPTARQAQPLTPGQAQPPTAGQAQPPTAPPDTAARRRRLRAVSGSGEGSAAGSRGRRPWALLAGAAAVVVLAVTAVEVRPPGEDGRKDTAATPPSTAPSSTPSTGPTARGHLDRQKTDGDDASGAPRGDGKGEPDKERKAKGAASGSPTPGATKGPDHGGSTRAPLTLSTRSHVWENGCGHRYVIDRPPSEVAPPPTEQDAPTWAAAHGAVHGGTTNVEVTVQGRASSAVVLQALHVRVVGRRTPLAWSSFAMDNGCGGSLTPRAFSVNLDASRPLARPTDGNDAGKPIPAVSFPYRVSASDPEVLLVNARTAGCDCSWYLELDWTSGGSSGTLRIDDHGSPFRTSSVKGRPQYAYDYADGAWYKSD